MDPHIWRDPKGSSFCGVAVPCLETTAAGNASAVVEIGSTSDSTWKLAVPSSSLTSQLDLLLAVQVLPSMNAGSDTALVIMLSRLELEQDSPSLSADAIQARLRFEELCAHLLPYLHMSMQLLTA